MNDFIPQEVVTRSGECKMRVHRVATVPVTAKVMHGGEEIEAVVPMCEVELVDETGQHGSWLLRFKRRAEIDAAKQKYVVGSEVVFPVL